MIKELYYWMYTYLRRIGTNNLPEFNSYVILCLLQMANIGTVIVIINYYLKIDVDRNIGIYAGLGLIIALYIVNYFLLFAPRKSIFKEYEGMLKDRRRKGQVYFWLYVIFSIIIFFVLGINLVSPR